MYIFAFLLIQRAFSSSAGSFAVDALGLCSEPSSGAYNNSGVIFCPKGMHSVMPPVRTDAYTIRTADGLPVNDPDEYLPDSILEVHIRTHNRYMKYLGLMIYAVKAGTISREGCPNGCDGKIEEKVGSWEIIDSVNFRTTYDGTILTHAQAKKRRFHHVLRFVTPPAGTGPIIFRAILKQGATNGGAFYWPMIDGDLQLNEGSSAPATTWVAGNAGATCSNTCFSRGMECDASAKADISAWNDVKYSTSCKFPLMSSCLDGVAMSRSSDGYCTFHAASECGAEAKQPDLCSATSNGAESICPCLRLPQAKSLSTGSIIGISFACLTCCIMTPLLAWYFLLRGEQGESKMGSKVMSFWPQKDVEGGTGSGTKTPPQQPEGSPWKRTVPPPPPSYEVAF